MSQAPETAPTLVLGVGNILLMDEGVGVRVVEAMRHADLPTGVELADGGTSGADLVDLIAGRQRLIVVDAIDAAIDAGSILRLGFDDLMPREGDKISLHQLGLAESLWMARQLGCLPPHIVILGIQPKEVRPGLALSPEISAIVPRIIEQVLLELQVSHNPGKEEA